MARRKIYSVKNSNIEVHNVEFKWFSGQSLSQKQKSINSLHEETRKKLSTRRDKIIEISTKSNCDLGVALSAFNLKTRTLKYGKEYSVESAYQSSKVFENGGPYIDIFFLTSREAKKDPRLQESGELLYFKFFNNVFELNSGSAFYDWLYINVLLSNNELVEQILEYKVFTDIEFNEKKSMNTQAFSLALFVMLKRHRVNMLDLKDPKTFLKLTRKFYEKIVIL